MKLITLNTHSHKETNYEKKLDILVNLINKELPDVIALQEVMQTASEEKLKNQSNRVGDVSIKRDNHAYRISNALMKKGIEYDFRWLGIKKSYDIYEEGVALFSKHKIEKSDHFPLSSVNDYNNWRTRYALGVSIKGTLYYSLHFNWCDDKLSPFSKEWERLIYNLPNDKRIFLMGDFNFNSREENEGYTLVKDSGWLDTYNLADIKDNGITVKGEIDGWSGDKEGKRIDYIFTNREIRVKASQVIFNKTDNIISDHFGILLEIN